MLEWQQFVLTLCASNKTGGSRAKLVMEGSSVQGVFSRVWRDHMRWIAAWMVEQQNCPPACL